MLDFFFFFADFWFLMCRAYFFHVYVLFSSKEQQHQGVPQLLTEPSP